jgi:DNA repair photolyase
MKNDICKMKLNEAKGNMYDFIDYTGNAIKGKCLHDCAYCYMKKWGNLGNIRLDKEELKGKIIENKFIFIGDSTDMFADNIPAEDIKQVLDYCACFNNKYLFQSKNPERFLDFTNHSIFSKSVVCTTIETNRYYPEYMCNSPKIEDRVSAMEKIANTITVPYQSDLFDRKDLTARNIKTYVTIEPIMKFDLKEMVELIKRCKPKQVNIGLNSRPEIELLEPTIDEIEELKIELDKFTEVRLKSKLKRLIKL